MRQLIYPAAVLLALGSTFAACTDEGKAQQDLPEENITNHVGDIDVLVNADKMPNLAHGCWETTGFWTTTDRVAIIIYNDHLCPGASVERPMTVINGNPRDVVEATAP